MASSVGKLKVTEWLLKCKMAMVNSKDAESGYTALHRAVYHGQIHLARFLLSGEINANVAIQDHDGLTALDHLSKDRPDTECAEKPAEVYIWGTNANFNLGLGHHEQKNQPTVIEHLRKMPADVKEVRLQKFHSAVLTSDGDVFTFGHGQGGRLGHGHEEPLLLPKKINLKDVSDVRLGVDHSVVLTDGGNIYTCGTNNFNVLGLDVPLGHVVSSLTLVTRKEKYPAAIGVSASRYHSCFWTKDSLWTWGLNGGQLGHTKGDKVGLPRVVSSLKEISIKDVSCSEGATIILTNCGEILALNGFSTKRRLTSRKYHDVVKIQSIGGHLNSVNLSETGGVDLRIFMMTKQGNIFVWDETRNAGFVRVVFNVNRQMFAKDFAVYKGSYLIVISEDGSGYEAEYQQRKVEAKKSKKTVQQGQCDVLKVKRRIFGIHRGLRAFCDPKGRNFAILQSNPYQGFWKKPEVSVPTAIEDLSELRSSPDLDLLKDLTIRVGNHEFLVHGYVVCSLNAILAGKIENGVINFKDGDITVSQNFDEILDAMYKGKFESVSKNPGDKPMKFTRKKFLKEFSDIILVSEDGNEFQGHQCVLAARLDYFRSMLCYGWSESGKNRKLNLPFPSKALKVLLDFIYTDEFPDDLKKCDDLDVVSQILILADHVLAKRLVEMSERRISELFTLKNIGEIVQFSFDFGVSQLFEASSNFIYQNLACLLESRGLDCLSDECCRQLTNFYLKTNKAVGNRKLTPLSNSPTSSNLAEYAIKAKILVEEVFEYEKNLKTEVFPKKTRKKSGDSVRSRRSSSSSVSTLSNIDSEDNFYMEERELVPASPKQMESRPKSVFTILQLPPDRSSTPSQPVLKGPPKIDETIPPSFTVLAKGSQDFPNLGAIVLTPKSTSKSGKVKKGSWKQLDLNNPTPERTKWSGWLDVSKDEEDFSQILRSEEKSEISKSTGGFSNKKMKWKQLDFSPTPPSAIPLPKNPWATNNSENSFRDILSQEAELKVNLDRAKMKSIKSTQIEEKAIEELLTFYNAAKTFDETITAERVQKNELATPIWNPKRG